MNIRELYQSPWSDEVFLALPDPYKLFLLSIFGKVDLAGWWQPVTRYMGIDHPNVDLKKAEQLLSPWCQVHPSGWWSLKGYVQAQCPNGLDPNSKAPFHRRLLRDLKNHQERESKASSGAAVVEGLPESGGLATGALGAEPVPEDEGYGQGLRSPIASPGSTESKSLGHKSLSRPTRGSGGAPGFPSSGDITAWGVCLGVLRTEAAPRGLVDVPPWALEGLERAFDDHGAMMLRMALKAYLGAVSPGGCHSFAEFERTLPRWLALVPKPVCQHSSKRWFCPKDKTFPKLRTKRWRCRLCRHTEVHSTFLQPHEHDWVTLSGDMAALGAQCTLCGVMQRELAQAAEGVAPSAAGCPPGRAQSKPSRWPPAK